MRRGAVASLMAPSIMAAVALLVLLAWQLIWGAAAAGLGLSGCNTTCGDVQVPYPFGIGPPRCHYPATGFNLTCEPSRHGRPPRLLLGDGARLLQVAEISLCNSTVRVVISSSGASVNTTTSAPVAWPGPDAWFGGNASDTPFVLAPGRANELVVTVCGMQATLRGADDVGLVSSCSSSCSDDGDVAATTTTTSYYPAAAGRSDKYCSGVGCCQAPIPVGRTSFHVRLRRLLFDGDGGARSAVRDKRARVFVAEAGWFDQESVGPEMLRHEHGDDTAVAVPVVLAWAIWPSGAEREKRAAATVNATVLSECTDDDAAWRICRSWESSCHDTGRGYTCACRPGFEGNPYIQYGCQDINECDAEWMKQACHGYCINTWGSYECVSATDLTIGLSVASSAMGLVLLILGTVSIIRKIKLRRAKRLKQKFFVQNRGQLLQQLMSLRADIAERMIIPLEELEKATNNFDPARVLGGGGHGMVYKGILSDLHVIAIKKPKNGIQREIDEFINEVAILSQINHRNVVRLFGCCLETQVLLLVYEFISNGTLHDHLHKEDTERSLQWKDRLRIAKEIAKAVAYLHSSISIPIIHRDIKSSNVLLEDASTAKVSDFGASKYIPIDQIGLATTAVQGTIGYLDPMYYRTGWLTEKSDVYSFGVILVELLTKKTPNSYRSPGGVGLVMQFNTLLEEGNLAQILDPQVVDEGGSEVKEVAALAALCTKSRGDERPTMRHVEVALEAFEEPKEHVTSYYTVADQYHGNIGSHYMLTKRSTKVEEASRQYSLEEEFYCPRDTLDRYFLDCAVC